ncbi:hypothetical protein NGM10_05015 [Halorussus salilacus]|uniref:hypothetical protein n=1 Tax=Halorussus salilacus TaxID=2953750 RepID=UPI0020A17B53|nr:hypothetical protein [Halorussus salilacus]USZ69100.1 hypothetical protein NGM10_05015 [Halorussus salilacus]
MGTKAVANYADSTSYIDLLDITGSKGMLKAIGVSGGENNHCYKITADGDDVIHSPHGVIPHFSIANNPSGKNSGMVIGRAFDDSLTIKIKDDARTVAPRFWAVYRIDSPITEEVEQTREETERNFAYIKNEKGNVTERVLQGRKNEVYISLERDIFTDEDQSIKGEITPVDWKGNMLKEFPSDELELIVSVPGRTHSLAKETFWVEEYNYDNNSSFRFESELLLPDYTGSYLLTTNFKTGGNHPAKFTKLS